MTEPFGRENVQPVTLRASSAARPRSIWILTALLGLFVGVSGAAPPRPLILVVLGNAADGGRLPGAARGAGLAIERQRSVSGPLAAGVRVEVLDTGGSAAGVRKALKRARALRPVAVLALPSGDLDEVCWKGADSLKVPWVSLTGRAPDRLRTPDYFLHLGPTPVGQGIAAADAALAPLAARRVAVLHAASAWGRDVASAFARNLSPQIALAGALAWDASSPGRTLRSLRSLEAGWIHVALGGAALQEFGRALAATSWRPRLFFGDGARDESLLAVAGEALEGCVFLGAADPELQGRDGEALVQAVEGAGASMEAVTPRAYEVTRRLLEALKSAGSTRLKPLWEALAVETPAPGVLGPLAFEPHGAVRLWTTTYWRVRAGRFELWPQGLLPTPGCGPPLGFGAPRTASLNPKGKLGVLTWGSAEKRTIERDLEAIQLSTGGRHADLDALVRAEILARAIRIANRLFRREPDGTPVPGWSWGMAFARAPAPEEPKDVQRWLAVCAGDHEAAGGQAFGTWVAVYTTFLRRTMYVQRKLEPPLSDLDRPLLDGTYRWGTDRSRNFRADKIRCLMDGFASAMGLTLAHEFGHLCGCGHDTEHPTSIMNVVAGAGATWESAVWIPKHARAVTSSLGLEELPDAR